MGNLINSFASFPFGASLNLPGLISLWDKTSVDPTATIENDVINTWSDIGGNSNDATQTGTARPTLHLDAQSNREVEFNGADQWLQIGNPSELNFLAGTDAFTIVIQLGETIPTNGYFVSKAGSSAANRQWGVFYNAGALFTIERGSQNFGDHTLIGGDLVIWTVSLTNQTLTSDNTTVINNLALAGTSNDVSANVNMGSRTDGSFLCDGSLALIAIYDRVLTAQELTDIRNEFGN